MKKILLFMLLFTNALGLLAERIDFSLDGIDYQIISETSKTCMTIGANVSGDITIPSIVQGYSVILIGNYSFSRCEDLISVIIPSTVTRIGESAFTGRTIRSVVIPNSVTEIGAEAFSYCSRLASVDIPNSVTTIEYGTFGRCKSLVSVTIPNSVTKIGQEAFIYCSNLLSVNIPTSVTEIGAGAFSGCNNLLSIDIPDSVTLIGAKAFAACRSLLSVDIPNSISKIFDNTFVNCEKLKSVNMPNSVVSIKSGAFKGCKSLTSVVIPGSVNEIASGAFADCKNMMSVRILAENPPSVGKESFEDHVVKYVPSASLNNYRKNWSDISHVIGFETQRKLDISLKEAGFLINDFMNLSEAEIHQVTVLKISGNMNGTDFLTLNKMINITELDLSDANIVSGGMDYYTVDNLKYGTKNNTIKRYQLNGLTAIQNLVLPKTLKSIDDYAFKSYTSLRSVTIGGSVTKIGEGAFEGSGLTSVVIPNSVARIDGYAFKYCYVLTSVTLSNSITKISDDTFGNCNSLTSIVIPDGVTSIGRWAFEDCTNLKMLTIPNSVKSIGMYAFSGCENVSSLKIPESLTKIIDGVFGGCKSLTSIVIPYSVKEIGSGAFAGCTGLTSVYCPNLTPPSIENDSFSNYDILLYIPVGSKTSYWLHPVWSQFNLEEFDFAGVGEVSVETESVFIEYYNLNGIKVAMVAPGEQPCGLPTGIYITKCGAKTSKTFVK